MTTADDSTAFGLVRLMSSYGWRRALVLYVSTDSWCASMAKLVVDAGAAAGITITLADLHGGATAEELLVEKGGLGKHVNSTHSADGRNAHTIIVNLLYEIHMKEFTDILRAAQRLGMQRSGAKSGKDTQVILTIGCWPCRSHPEVTFT